MKKKAIAKAPVSPLSSAKAAELFDLLSDHIWHRTALCPSAQKTLKARQASGDLGAPAAKSLASLTAKSLQHFKGTDGMPTWDPAVCGSLMPLLADPEREILIGEEHYPPTRVVAAYCRARGGAEGAVEALWYAAKLRKEDGILAPSDPTNRDARRRATELSADVREVLGKKGIQDAAPAIDGLIETGEWYQRWAVALVAPTPERLAVLLKTGTKGNDWLDGEHVALLDKATFEKWSSTQGSVERLGFDKPEATALIASHGEAGIDHLCRRLAVTAEKGSERADLLEALTPHASLPRVMESALALHRTLTGAPATEKNRKGELEALLRAEPKVARTMLDKAKPNAAWREEVERVLRGEESTSHEAIVESAMKGKLAHLKKLFGKRAIPPEVIVMCRHESECDSRGKLSLFKSIDELGMDVDPASVHYELVEFEGTTNRDLRAFLDSIVWVMTDNAPTLYGYLHRKSDVLFVGYDSGATFVAAERTLFDFVWGRCGQEENDGDADVAKEAKKVLQRLAKESKLAWVPPKKRFGATPEGERELAELNRAFTKLLGYE
ncbi:MAG: hypothetical protein JWO86_7589 [Myxococcaceae bacterium]|nr:hypothetical protein [Myxococcaceae bacterium]